MDTDPVVVFPFLATTRHRATLTVNRWRSTRGATPSPPFFNPLHQLIRFVLTSNVSLSSVSHPLSPFRSSWFLAAFSLTQISSISSLSSTSFLPLYPPPPGSKPTPPQQVRIQSYTLSSALSQLNTFLLQLSFKMKFSLSLLAVATIMASEAMALSGSHDNPTSHDLIRRHHKLNKRTCKPKKSSSTGSGKAGTSSNSGSGSGSSSGSGLKAGPKVGLAWTYGTYMDITKFIGNGQAAFWYDWKSGGQGAAGPKAPAYWPMLWGNDGQRISDWQKNVMSNPSKITSKVVMGPNEPEIPSQSNMSPQAACDLMRKYLIPLKNDHGFRIVGPAVVTLEGPWYGNFKKACPDVHDKIDALPVHIYAGMAGPAIKQMENYHQAHGKPLLITEMACHSFYVTSSNPVCKNSGQAAQFMQQISSWAKNTEWMLSVAPFGLFKDNLPDGLASFNKLSDGNGNPTWMWDTFVKNI